MLSGVFRVRGIRSELMVIVCELGGANLLLLLLCDERYIF